MRIKPKETFAKRVFTFKKVWLEDEIEYGIFEFVWRVKEYNHRGQLINIRYYHDVSNSKFCDKVVGK